MWYFKSAVWTGKCSTVIEKNQNHFKILYTYKIYDGAYNFSQKSGGFTKFVQAGSLINETFLVLFLVGCLSFYLWQ